MSTQYGAYAGGVNSFLDSALKMVEFTDRRNERADQVNSEREQARHSVMQKKAARDVYALGVIKKIEPGGAVAPEWLPVLNNAYPEIPDFESVERMDDGIVATTKTPFINPNGAQSTQMTLTTEQIETMFNQRLSSLDTVGLEMYGKLNEAYGINAISPSQRAAAFSNLIDIKRRSAAELEAAGDFDSAKQLWDEVETLGRQYEDFMGIELSTPEDPKTNHAQERYMVEYEKFSSGKGLFNNRGIGEGESQRLDELWSITGLPPNKAPHRNSTEGQPPAPTPTAEPLVQVVGPDGVTYDVPKSQVEKVLQQVPGSQLQSSNAL